MFVNDNECEAAGLDPKEIKRIAAGLQRYIKQANKLDLQIFGGSDTASLRFDDGGCGQLIVAAINGNISGGCGAASDHDDGLLRGESA